MKRLLYLLSILALLAACTPTPKDVQQSSELPPIYPDYCDVTIPVNIAPLNFLLRADCEAIEVKVGNITINTRGNEVTFDMDDWKVHKLASIKSIILLNTTAVGTLLNVER